jgi:TRAP-type C4-dicarboxylate transport system permease small subunit
MRFWKAIWDFEWGMAAIGAGICLFAMMMITVISVFGRYFLHADLIPGAYNIVERVVFPLMVFWALPLAHREGMFPRLEGTTDSLPPRMRAAIGFVVLAVEVLIYAAILWFVLRFVADSIKVNRPMQVGANFWPLWPILIMMPLAFGLMLLEMVRLLVADARAAFGLASSGKMKSDS